MTPERWRRIEEIFHEALQRDAAERGRFLDRACAGDGDVRREVEALLASDEGAGAGFLRALPAPAGEVETIPPRPGAALDFPGPAGAAGAAPPGSIGPYRLLHKLGEGGMGMVYLAEQTGPIRRRVALKLIKAGMGSRDVVSRFEAERQTLALMNHPCIASVYDAGATADGRPYFVMEFVEGGVPITVFCDERRLDVPGRLRLFLDLLAAVQHAHQKGVIHRDLKPSNVLVALADGKPTCKIIDFGIAKAMDPATLEMSFYTQTGQIIGTPGYMSPEQTYSEKEGIDTRADIYSLGAILYELLVGTIPLDLDERRATDFLEIIRSIREVEPRTPSTRLPRLGEAGAVAARRRADFKLLRKQLRGDLDWITLKALEKDPARRYASASELAADIERHLRDEPVLASPPGLLYRARKFARRHRWPAAAVTAATFLVLLAAGLGWYTKLRESKVFLGRGDDARASFLLLRDRRAEGERLWRAKAEEHQSWQPAWEREDEIQAWRRLEALRKEIQDHYYEALVAYQQAADEAPPLAGVSGAAMRALEALYFAGWQESRARGDFAFSPEFFRKMIEEMGLGTYARDLRGAEEVRVESEPPGAEVYCFRFETSEEHLLPLPFHPRSGLLAGPLLVVSRVRPDHEVFRPGDRLVGVAAGGGSGAAPVAVRTRGDLARALAAVPADGVVEAVVERRGEELRLGWTPFPRQRLTEVLRAGRVLDTFEQFGVLFAGYPLEFTPACLLGRTGAGTPLAAELPAGSYLLVLRREGHADARLPVLVPGGGGAPERVRLFRAEDVPPGFVAVAAGSFGHGGEPEAYRSLDRGSELVPDFFMSRTEVTFREYLEFINASETRARLARTGEKGLIAPLVDWNEPALRRLRPPQEAGVDLMPRFLERREGYVPLLVLEGDVFRLRPDIELDPERPVFGLSLFAGLEYARWLTERHGGRWRFRLPTDFEWEKAARGADRRRYVWGEYPIYAHCNSMLGSYPGQRERSQLAAAGMFPLDESVYGIADLAGSLSEFVLTDPARLPEPRRFATYRGANWDASDARDFFAASRNRLLPESHARYVGLRLVAEPAAR